jgi:hypothetical protein
MKRGTLNVNNDVNSGSFVLVLCTLLLTGCTEQPVSEERLLERCTVDTVFTCTVERDTDGRSFTVWLGSLAEIPVVDVTVHLERAGCIPAEDSVSTERIDPSETKPFTFTCTGLVPTHFGGSFTVDYTLVSGYAGDPPRFTQGEFLAHAG